MKGMDLSRAYYREYGAPMIHREFPEYEGMIAVGLCGSGSECYGYDDELSQDHDFEPGFCLFLPDEDSVSRQAAFQLEKAYLKLPDEFEGYRRQKLSPAGGNRHGVLRIRDFYQERLGLEPENLSVTDWLRIPVEALAEAVNGELFRDDSGRMTGIRKLLRNMPEDARRKRIAGHMVLLGQSGQYNYERCLRHGEPAAAQLAVTEFVRNAMAVIFLLNRTYMPYYKWSFRALRSLPEGEETARSAEWLLTTPNEESLAKEKAFCMAGITSWICSSLTGQGLSKASGDDPGRHAASVNDGIQDSEVRNLHILCAV